MTQEEARKKLKEFKIKADLSLRQLAVLFKTTRQRVARWLDGTSEIPVWIKIYLNWLG